MTKKGGLSVKNYRLDNEISADFMTAGAKYELIPPDEHRQNVAEHTIQMWKNHFTNVLAGLHVTFPMHLL